MTPRPADPVEAPKQAHERYVNVSWVWMGNVSGQTPPYACRDCGAVVIDRHAHDEWHDPDRSHR
jgi:hypothetical protein